MPETVDLGKFPLGMNNVAKETSLPEGSLREATNVDIDDTGNVRLRQGFELLYSGNNIDSLYKRFFREGNDFKYLHDDNTAEIIGQVIGRLSYIEVNEKIYFTDGNRNQYVDSSLSAELLGIETPRQVTGSVTGSGGMAPGQYQVTCAYTNGTEVSGTPTATQFELTSTGGLSLNIPQPIGNYSIVIYVSGLNDARLFHQVIIPKGTITYPIYTVNTEANICKTLNLNKLPAGQIIEYYKGKIYVAKDNVLWYSEPHRYGLTRNSRNFFNFADRITICAAVDNGIFVVADKTYFITFNKDTEAKITEVSQNKAVEGTSLKISGGDLKFDFESECAYWFSEIGPVVGLPNGQVQNLTEDVMAVPDNTSSVGSSLFRETNGIKQLISTMAQGGEISELKSNDKASITVIRNGIAV